MRVAGETSAHAHHHLRRHTARLLGTGLAGGGLVLAATLLFAGGGDDSWALAARHTARFSALWFMVAFVAGPLARITRASWARVLVRERRGIGLGFCAAHTVHLAAILLWLGHGGKADAATLAGGGLAYLFLLAMAATSNDAAVRRLKAPEESLFTGRFWTGREAVGLGLADALGDAEGEAKRRFGEKVRIIRLGQRRRPFPWRLIPGAREGVEALAAAAEERAAWARLGL